MLSWLPTQFTPDSYKISYSCQLLCGSFVQQHPTVSANGASSSHIIPADPGSHCAVSITAVFGSNTSNTVTATTSTLFSGIYNMHQCKFKLSCIVYLLPHAAPTAAPVGLTNTSVERRSLSVVWGTVPCPHQRGPITGYRLRYSNGTSIVNTTGEGSRQHVLTGLTPFTNYSVQVAAVNDGGTGSYSTPLTVKTLQDGECMYSASNAI